MKRPLLIVLGAVAWVAAAFVLVRRLRDRPAEHPEERVMSERPLETMTRDELYELARERDIAGRSKMKKDELLAALNGATRSG